MLDNLLYSNISSTLKTLETENTESKSKSRVNNDLDKNAFLNLLVTQMKYQDPLNPTEDKEFLAQMAQFSSLEQMQNMTKSFSKQQGTSMIGKYVEAVSYNESTKLHDEISGVVSAVVLKNGETYLLVDGKEVKVDDVNLIIDDSSSAVGNINQNIAINQSIDLIGKFVQAITVDKDMNPTGFVEGMVDYVKLDSNGNAILVIGDKEIYAGEVTSVSKEAMLVGKEVSYEIFDKTTESTIEKQGLVSKVIIKDSIAYLAIGNDEIPIDKINYINDALRLIDKTITHEKITGVVEGVVIKGKIPYLKVNGELISFKEYQSVKK